MTFESISKIGIGSALGVLFGLIAIWWIKPTSSEGAILLIGICVLITTVVGGIVEVFRKKSGH